MEKIAIFVDVQNIYYTVKDGLGGQFDYNNFWRKVVTENVNVEKVGEVTVPNVFPTLSVSPGEVKTLGPSLGQNNSIFYEKEMGLSENEIHELKVDGVI